jgi:molybdopterin converting factor small subunit
MSHYYVRFTGRFQEKLTQATDECRAYAGSTLEKIRDDIIQQHGEQSRSDWDHIARTTCFMAGIEGKFPVLAVRFFMRRGQWFGY